MSMSTNDETTPQLAAQLRIGKAAARRLERDCMSMQSYG